jgi:hypothetical protein
MSKLDVREVISRYSLDKKQVAVSLFPNVSFPVMALKRICDGEALLNSDQVSRLASLARVSVSNLYEGGWETVKSKGPTYVFENEEYRAELSKQTFVTKLYHKGSLFHEDVITAKTTTLSDYLKALDGIISKERL